MKKIFLMLLCPALLWGCKDFLDETSQDEFRPKTVAELMRVAYGEAYPVNEADRFVPFLDLLTDDVQSNYSGLHASDISALKQGEPAFTWAWEMFDKMAVAGSAGAEAYQKYYDKIMGCNVVLDYCGDMIGTEAERGNMRGQMLALRSFYYLQLVNLFAAPYNAPGIDPATAPGVVLLLESAARDEFPARATIQQVYDQIESDLLEAIPLLAQYGQSNQYFQTRPLFPVLILARTCLYEEKWDDALKYAQMVIDQQPTLMQLSNNFVEIDYFNYMIPGVFSPESSEMIWANTPDRAAQGDYFKKYSFSATDLPSFIISPEMLSLYKMGANPGQYGAVLTNEDVRPEVYLSHYQGIQWARVALGAGKGQQAGISNEVFALSRGLRNVEAYLIRAEVNAMKFAETGNAAARTQALSDINLIGERRWNLNNSTYTPVEPVTGEEVVQAVRDERRRELIFEELRWFDLRRYGMPEITHTFQASAEAPVQTFTLSKGDARYVLPIPAEALNLNPALKQNEYPKH